jgi:hypothetical protein
VDLALLLERILIGVVAPVWLMAGWLDYACHRHQRIEASAGVRESRLHLLMLAELGAGVVAALFLEIDAAVLALLALVCVAHEVTMVRDLAYAQSQRRIPWYEQWVHGVQQALPWIAFGILVVLHWPQAQALVGAGPERADWSLRWKSEPLPAWYIVAFLLAATGAVGLPFLSEWRRCRRVTPVPLATAR